MTDKFSIERFVDPVKFQPTVEGFLETDLVLNMLPFYVSKRARLNKEPSEGLVVRDKKDRIALTAFRALPFHFLVSSGNLKAAKELGAHIAKTDCPGITGPLDVCKAICNTWEAETGRTAVKDMTSTFYLLTPETIKPFKKADGQIRLATKDDLDALIPLMKEAYIDMKMPAEESEHDVIHATLSYAIAEGAQLVWDDNGIKATVRGIAHKPKVRFINLATDKKERGKGYGTSLIGGLSIGMFNSGFDMVMLQADDENPFSNRLYLKLGFKEHTKTAAFTFPAS